MMVMKYRGGRKLVIYCAHFGMEANGVINPLIKLNKTIKKNIANMACSIVYDLFAIATPKPEIDRIISTEAKYIVPILPVGYNP